jgi:hypothetical protein
MPCFTPTIWGGIVFSNSLKEQPAPTCALMKLITPEIGHAIVLNSVPLND